MLNVDTAEFHAMIQTLVTTQLRTTRAGLCLTMGLGHRRMNPSLHIFLRTNAKTLAALCLVDMLVSIAMYYPVLRGQVDHQTIFDPLKLRAS